MSWTVSVTSESGRYAKGITTTLGGWTDSYTRTWWAPWGAPPGVSTATWSNPTTPVPFSDATLSYGGNATSSPPGNGFAEPDFSIIEQATDHSLSLIQAPTDNLFDGNVTTTSSGDLSYTRLDNRIQTSPAVTFHMNLVASAADWRGGFGWLENRYPAYFKPAEPSAWQLAGLGTYSSHPGPFGQSERRTMADIGYKTNWEVSLRGPYMGEFLPPVTSASQTWKSFLPTIDPGNPTESVNSLRTIAQNYVDAGIHDLAYFDANFFGENMPFPAPSPLPTSCSDPDRWADPVSHLYCDFPNALYLQSNGQPINDGKYGFVMDPGDPAYQQHLVDQAKRLLSEVPQYSGINIDETQTWLRFNSHADDGVSWVNGGPARSLVSSAKALMPRLEAAVHKLGKYVFISPTQAKRIDWYKAVDGIFSEYDNDNSNMNLDAWIGAERPTLGWNYSVSDAVVQHYLFMGVDPMSNIPFNDHGLAASTAADAVYADYQPMIAAMQGREVLTTPHAVKVTGGSAIANAYTTPDGVVVPIIDGGSDTRATVALAKLASAMKTLDLNNPQYLVPGATSWQDLKATTTGGTTTVTTPLARGAALVRFPTAAIERGVSAQSTAPVTISLSAGDLTASANAPATLTATITNQSSAPLVAVQSQVTGPSGWKVTALTSAPGILAPGQSAKVTWRVIPDLASTATTADFVSRASAISQGQTVSGRDSARVTAGALVPQSTITATASSEQAGDPASNAVDGNDQSVWQSAAGAGGLQSVTLDLHGDYHLAGLTYLPRQDGALSGNIDNYTVSVSSDGTTFTPMAVSNFSLDDAGTQAVTFDAPSVRYVRLQADPPPAGSSGCTTSAVVNAAEINVITAPAGWTGPTNPPPTTPPEQAFPNVVPHSGMTATATSQQAGYPASNAIDDNPCTIWHTEYRPVYQPLPQSITLDLGQTYNTTGLAYLPRQDGSDSGVLSANDNGKITDYTIATSTDGATWTDMAQGTWDTTGAQKVVPWQPTEARYVRLTANQGVAFQAGFPEGLASAAELEVGFN